MAQQERPKRSASWKGYGCLVIVLLAIGLFYSLRAYDRASKANTEAQHRAQTEQQQAKADAQEHQKQEIIQRLAQKHHAITANWDQKVKEGYTADLQQSMMRNDGQPIIFIAYLQDVVQKEDRYVLFFGPRRHLITIDPLSARPRGYYIIECKTEQTNVVWEDTREKHRKEFAVVAVISAVSKPGVEARIEERGSTQTEATIGLDTSIPTFVARGSCVELLPLPVQAADEKTEAQPYMREKVSQ